MELDEKIKQIVLEVLDKQNSQAVENKSPKKLGICYVIGERKTSLPSSPLINFLPLSEKEELPELSTKDCLLAASLSLSDLAKVALGIADNRVTKLFMQALLKTLPIYIIKEGIEGTSGSLSYQKLFVTYERTIQSYGIRFIKKEQLGSIFSSPSSKTFPATLTLADIAHVKKFETLELSQNTVITYAAREKLHALHVQIRYSENRNEDQM